jgi:hypothetical protein
MAELLTLLAFFVGIPLLITGWIWSCVVAKSINQRWFVFMWLLFPFTLPVTPLFHWQKIKWPFVTTTIAMLILLSTWWVLPD